MSEIAPTPGLATRDDLRNVAIVAHVDHGKTTLVDAMLWQSGSFRANQDVAERVLDSMDLEREKGITILSKNTAVRLGGTKINIIDTPGHADFGGEVERGLTMVDGILLLVDASEGPAAADPLRAAQGARAKPARRARREQDRPARRARSRRSSTRCTSCSSTSTRPRRRSSSRSSTRSRARVKPGSTPDTLADDLGPLFDTMLATIPAPTYDPDHPLQALVTNLDASPYVGRLALLRDHARAPAQGPADRLVPRQRRRSRTPA